MQQGWLRLPGRTGATPHSGGWLPSPPWDAKGSGGGAGGAHRRAPPDPLASIGQNLGANPVTIPGTPVAADEPNQRASPKLKMLPADVTIQ